MRTSFARNWFFLITAQWSIQCITLMIFILGFHGGQPEEVQRAAIEEASGIQNLWLFIQPMILQNPKAVWENCAIILAQRTDSELEPYLNQIFEWLQDLNWPGAIIIHNRLLDMEEQMCSKQLSRSQKQAQRENDDEWLFNLKYLHDKIRL